MINIGSVNISDGTYSVLQISLLGGAQSNLIYADDSEEARVY